MILVIYISAPQPLMDKNYLQDTCGVHNLHGIPGVFSGIAAAIAASMARKVETDNNHVAYGDRLDAVSTLTIRMCCYISLYCDLPIH